jgi:dihydroorotate dehydrogenase (fumarate)
MNLTSRYMGLTLKNPMVASASPLSQRVDTIRQLEDHGAAAVVMFSLFEEQIQHDMAAMEHFMAFGTESFGEALSYFPAVEDFDVGPAQYLDLVRKASAAVDIPIIASLNGTSERGWVDFATLMQEAGAKGLELNIYYIPTEMRRTGAEVEEQYLDVLARVRAAVTIEDLFVGQRVDTRHESAAGHCRHERGRHGRYVNHVDDRVVPARNVNRVVESAA